MTRSSASCRGLQCVPNISRHWNVDPEILQSGMCLSLNQFHEYNCEKKVFLLRQIMWEKISSKWKLVYFVFFNSRRQSRLLYMFAVYYLLVWSFSCFLSIVFSWVFFFAPNPYNDGCRATSRCYRSHRTQKFRIPYTLIEVSDGVNFFSLKLEKGRNNCLKYV